MPDYAQAGARPDRRRPLLRRRRARRDAETAAELPADGPDLLDTPAAEAVALQPFEEGETGETAAVSAPEWPEIPARRERKQSRRRRAAPAREPAPPRDRNAGREPRHVRAVPATIEHKISSAIKLFNDSQHPRTVAGVGRSLGLPDVSVHPSDPVASVVNVVVSWELCWYRYEVDLSEQVPSVRVGGQGYELDELSALERQTNATADDRGLLALSA